MKVVLRLMKSFAGPPDPGSRYEEPGPGGARLREVFAEAGFTRFRRAAETPMNLILECR